jgi:hypothetical protein
VRPTTLIDENQRGATDFRPLPYVCTRPDGMTNDRGIPDQESLKKNIGFSSCCCCMLLLLSSSIKNNK